MIVDGSRNFDLHFRLQVFIERLHARVESADNSLQFGEFLHQFGRQIGLRQQRGLVNHARAGSAMPFCFTISASQLARRCTRSVLS